MRAAARELDDMLREAGIDPHEPREAIDLEAAIKAGLEESKAQQKRASRAIRRGTGVAAKSRTRRAPTGAGLAPSAGEPPTAPVEPQKPARRRRARPLGHAGWYLPHLYDTDDE
jgi:hypothetical protein